MTETKNNVFGKASNPFDASKTCGGSSGGDAILISTRSAVLSLCNDLGGSIRIPASYCGVYAFKPSSQRMTNKGTIKALTSHFGQ